MLTWHSWYLIIRSNKRKQPSFSHDTVLNISLSQDNEIISLWSWDLNILASTVGSVFAIRHTTAMASLVQSVVQSEAHYKKFSVGAFPPERQKSLMYKLKCLVIVHQYDSHIKNTHHIAMSEDGVHPKITLLPARGETVMRWSNQILQSLWSRATVTKHMEEHFEKRKDKLNTAANVSSVTHATAGALTRKS